VETIFKHQFVNFILVSTLNTAFGFTVFSAFIGSGLTYTMAIALSTISGVLFNFQTIGRLVFKDSNWRRLARFIAVYLFLYGLNVLGVSALINLSLNVYLAYALLIGPVAFLGYILQKHLVFNQPVTPKPD
jgi:putative flippase GtrA